MLNTYDLNAFNTYWDVFNDGNLNQNFNIRQTIFLQWAYNRLKRGFSPLVLVVGPQRVGKTSLGLKMAWELSQMTKRKFNIDTDMFYSITDFANKYKTENHKIYVIDEAGVSLGKYEHWSQEQHVYDKIINTQAYKGNILFIILPFATDISRQHIKHIDMILDVFDRGKYRLKKPLRWHSDMSFKPPKTQELEVISGVSYPPPEIWERYMTAKQASYKEDILDMQIGLLNKKKIMDQAKMERYLEDSSVPDIPKPLLNPVDYT